MRNWKIIATGGLLILSGYFGPIYAQNVPGQFKDGEKAVFFGDSITHGGWYEYYIQLFYATRFPYRKIQFENAGVAGATATGSLSRINNDVIVNKPDWVYIMFGMNDVGRDNYRTLQTDQKIMDARSGSLKIYKSSMDTTIKKIKDSGAVPVIVTPSPYDQYGRNINTENYTACNDGLAKCSEIARTLAAENKCLVADIHTPITELMIKNTELKLAGMDRVHPDQAGHMVIAYYILQAQKVPELVSEIVIDSAAMTVDKTEKCSVENLKFKDGSVKFTYSPMALPFPVSSEYSKANKIIPWESLNQEIIQVKNFPAGDYRLLTDGKEVGCFSATQFASGVNIAPLTTPRQERSAQIRLAVIAKADADRPLRGLVQVNCILWDAKISPADIPTADKYLDEWLAKVGEQYKKYYTNVIKSYRGNRNILQDLTKKAKEAQDKIFELQKLEPCLIEIIRQN